MSLSLARIEERMATRSDQLTGTKAASWLNTASCQGRAG